MIPRSDKKELKRLEAKPVSASFYTVQDDQGSAWIGYGSAYWGQTHYAEARVATIEEAEARKDAAKSYGYDTEVVFHDMAKGRARRIELLKARIAA